MTLWLGLLIPLALASASAAPAAPCADAQGYDSGAFLKPVLPFRAACPDLESAARSSDFSKMCGAQSGFPDYFVRFAQRKDELSEHFGVYDEHWYLCAKTDGRDSAQAWEAWLKLPLKAMIVCAWHKDETKKSRFPGWSLPTKKELLAEAGKSYEDDRVLLEKIGLAYAETRGKCLGAVTAKDAAATTAAVSKFQLLATETVEALAKYSASEKRTHKIIKDHQTVDAPGPRERLAAAMEPKTAATIAAMLPLMRGQVEAWRSEVQSRAQAPVRVRVAPLAPHPPKDDAAHSF
jgi:hypothetical protein